MLSSKTKRELKIDQRQILIDSIEIGIPSPQQILTWGERLLPNGKKVGLIKNSKTVNYKRFTPFRDGLFCERIFGPVTSFVCACGKKQPHSKVTFCEKCEVEYIDQRARRYRLGYISLLSPVTHIWYLKGRPSYLSLFLGKRKKTIVALAYCNAYLIEHSVSTKKNSMKNGHIWPYMRSFSNTENFFQSRASKTSYSLPKRVRSLPSRIKTLTNLLQKSAYKPEICTYGNFTPWHEVMDSITYKFGLHTGAKSNSKSKILAWTSKKPLLSYAYKSANTKFCCAKWSFSCKATKTDRRFVDMRPNQRFVYGAFDLYGLGDASTKRKTKNFTNTTQNLRRTNLQFIGRNLYKPVAHASLMQSVHSLYSQQRLLSFDVQKLAKQQKQIFDLYGVSSFVRRFETIRNTRPFGVRFVKKRSKIYTSSNAPFNKINGLAGPILNNFNGFPLGKEVKSNGVALFPEKSKRIFSENFYISGSAQEKKNGIVKSPCNLKGFQKALTNTFFREKRWFSGKASSYGTYFYARQHTLPFLPTLVSHFYLRDALLNFTYSLAAYDDFPLMEYCHTTRWEPLRDVHKFMAHRTVDNLKNDMSSIDNRSIKNFTKEPKDFRKLRGYKISLKGDFNRALFNPKEADQKVKVTTESYGFFQGFAKQNGAKQQNRRKKLEKKLDLCLRKKNQTKSFAQRMSSLRQLDKLVFRNKKQKKFCFGHAWQKNKQDMLYKSDTNRRFVVDFVASNVFVATLSFAKQNGAFVDFVAKQRKLHFALQNLANQRKQNLKKEQRKLPRARTNLRFVEKDLYAGASQIKDLCARQNLVRSFVHNGADFQQLAELDFECNFGAKGISVLPEEPKRGKWLYHQGMHPRHSNALLKQRATNRRTYYKAWQTSTNPRDRMARKQSFVSTFIRNQRDVKKSAHLKLDFISTRQKKKKAVSLCTNEIQIRDLYARTRTMYKSHPFFVEEGENGRAAMATKNEESNKSLLSGLELTAIREILSYTGGGALQKLLQGFNQHDLCKFLFAEAQILRLLYETQISTGLSLKDTSLTLAGFSFPGFSPSLPSTRVHKPCIEDAASAFGKRLCRAKSKSLGTALVSKPYFSSNLNRKRGNQIFDNYKSKDKSFYKRKKDVQISNLCLKEAEFLTSAMVTNLRFVSPTSKAPFHAYKSPICIQSFVNRCITSRSTSTNRRFVRFFARTFCYEYQKKSSLRMHQKISRRTNQRFVVVDLYVNRGKKILRTSTNRRFVFVAQQRKLHFAMQNLVRRFVTRSVRKIINSFVSKMEHKESYKSKICACKKIFTCKKPCTLFANRSTHVTNFGPRLALSNFCKAKWSFNCKATKTYGAKNKKNSTSQNKAFTNLPVDSNESARVQTSDLHPICSSYENVNYKSKTKSLELHERRYEDFQNKASDLRKKQILRISRRIYKVARRLKIVQLLTRNHRKPEWMILSHLPVLPPDLRPILQMSEKVIVASDLNIMYQRVIYRNNRHLRVRFIDFHLVTAIQRLVQDAVDRLIENGKGGSKPYYTQGGRPLKSLSDILKGKKGRFRLNLLGKRVDFSGRSVIVVSPLCQIHECGLPKEIALELYHYFLLRQLIVKKQCASIVTAKKMIKSKSSLMWDILRELMYHHPVLLNRAPTLHRLGIQAFQPKLVLGNAILLHPLVCSGFNADFDGDQMGVHLPLSFAARAESWDLLWSRNNLLSPATGQPMLVPSQDMVLGFYYITAQALPKISRAIASRRNKNRNGCNFVQIYENKSLSTNRRFVSKASKTKLFSERDLAKICTKTNNYLDVNEITTSLQTDKIKLHTPVWLHWKGKIENETGFQKPLELRINGFGVQQSIYEKYICSSFFTKTQVTVENRNLFLKLSSFCINKTEFCTYKSPICNRGEYTYGETDQSKILQIKDNFNLGNSHKPSCLICAKMEAYYLRTTAGRVLMNNLIF